MISPPSTPYQPHELSDAAELYAATFAGRRDAYTFWNGTNWQTAERRIPGHPPERLPLTAKVVLRAFETGIPISAYLLDRDSYTHLACLDIDREDGLQLGYRVARVIQQRGGIGYLEPSSRGCHVWLVLNDRRPAILIRSALRALIAEAELPDCTGVGKLTVTDKASRPICPDCKGAQPQERKVPPHPDPRIELRPAQDRLNNPDSSLGNCLRMPTMPHHKTGRRYPLASTDGERLSGRLFDLMLNIEECPVTMIDTLAELAPLPKLGRPPLDLSYPHGDPPGDDSVSRVLLEVWGMADVRLGTANICPAHDDHRPSLSVARDDQRVWCKTAGCDLYNDGKGRGANELRRLGLARKGH